MASKKRNSRVDLKQRLIRFHVPAGLAGAVNYGTLLLLALVIGLWDISANIIGIGFGVLVNYFLNSRLIWKEQLEKDLEY